MVLGEGGEKCPRKKAQARRDCIHDTAGDLGSKFERRSGGEESGEEVQLYALSVPKLISLRSEHTKRGMC